MTHTKKIVLLAAAMGMMSTSLFAQKSVVKDALAKYQVDANILNPDIRQRPEDLSFDYKYTSIESEQKKVTLAKFDARKTGDERWIVLSVHGGTPSATEISKFRKEHRKPQVAGTKIDESSMKVEKESADELVISYKINAATLSQEASFLKDCRNFLTINLNSKRLVQLQTVSEKPVKIKIIKANKLDLTIKYFYDEEEKRYLPNSEDLVIDVKILGQEAEIETISEYSNYAKH